MGTNTKGQQVYIVKTYGNTGNAGHFTEGDKREVHNVNTVGEFKSSLENKDGHWYSVYWRCQKSHHAFCTNHDKPEAEYKKQIAEMPSEIIAEMTNGAM